MAQTLIRIKCEDQKLEPIVAPLIASGGVNETRVVFEFCELWNGFAKTAVFQHNKGHSYEAVLDAEDGCTIPSEVLTKQGNLFFGVYGVNAAGIRRTSVLLKYKIEQGVVEGLQPEDPSPDVYEQLLAELAEIKSKELKIVPATAEVLGGIKLSEYMNTTEDGTLVIPKLEQLPTEGNVSHTDNSVAFGMNNVVGGRGFKIKDIDYDKPCIYLDSVEGLEVGDVYSMTTNPTTEDYGTITYISNYFDETGGGYRVDVDKLPPEPDGGLENVEGSRKVFWINTKPNAGTIQVRTCAFVAGDGNIATGMNSAAFGSDNKAYGKHSFVEGSKNTAYWASHAEGRQNLARGEASHAEGRENTASGNFAHVEGLGNVASGECSHAEGQATESTAACSHAEGYNTTASKECSHAEGSTTIASGQNSHAEGYGTESAGGNSHSEGLGSVSEGERSHAEGYKTKAKGNNSHAEGNTTIAQGDDSHAEGQQTHAEGICSHAEGYNTQATGGQAHAEGSTTQAKGQNSHAEGYNTIASGYAQHVQGINNIEDTAGRYAHIVGNGADGDNRSNAYTLDWNGNAWFAGSVEATQLYLKSPSGYRFLITVDDNGVLTTRKI